MMHRHIGLVKAMHAQHAEKLSIAARISAETHQGIGHGVIQSPRERCQLRTAFALNHAAPRINDGPFCSQQHSCGLANLTGVTFVRGLIGAQAHRLGILIREFVLRRRQILGNIDHDRSRSPR